MVKESIINHLNKSGKFLIIGKNSYNTARKITALTSKGCSVFDKVNMLPIDAQRCFYQELCMPSKIVIGTLTKNIELPDVIKKYCMILRLRE